MDETLKREIIMDNYQNPINRNIPEDDSFELINSNNPTCIDNIDVYILFDEDNLKDIHFYGEACAISTSSASIMIKNLIGKNINDAYTYIINFENMIYEKEYDKEILGEAIVYEEIYKQQNRVNCAILPYRGIKKVLEERLKIN